MYTIFPGSFIEYIGGVQSATAILIFSSFMSSILMFFCYLRKRMSIRRALQAKNNQSSHDISTSSDRSNNPDTCITIEPIHLKSNRQSHVDFRRQSSLLDDFSSGEMFRKHVSLNCPYSAKHLQRSRGSHSSVSSLPVSRPQYCLSSADVVIDLSPHLKRNSSDCVLNKGKERRNTALGFPSMNASDAAGLPHRNTLSPPRLTHLPKTSPSLYEEVLGKSVLLSISNS